MNRLFKGRGMILGIVLSLVLMSSLQSCERIDAGHVGLKVNLYGTDKGVSDITEVNGLVFYAPWSTDIIEFPTFSQTKDYDAFTVTAKGGTEFTVDPVVTYYVDSPKAPHIYKQYRRPLVQLENGILKNMVYDAYRIVVNKYSPDSLVNNRTQFENDLEKNMKSQFEGEGFTLQKVTSNLTPPASLKAAIDAKNNQIQIALTTENKIKTAEAEAKISIAKAEGENKAKRIEADGIYYYNQKVQQSLSQPLLQQMWIEKWNGTLPQYTGGGNSPMMMISPK